MELVTWVFMLSEFFKCLCRG